MQDDDGSQTDAWPNVWHREQKLQTVSMILLLQSRKCRMGPFRSDLQLP